MSLTITPIGLGELKVPKSHVTYHFNHGEYETLIPIAFLIQGGDHPILVDTGPSTPEWCKKYHGFELKQTKEQTLEYALDKLGVKPDEIKTVINTHLHWDHCFQNNLFKNAVFYVQKIELNYAIDPLELHRIGYEKIPGVTPPWLHVWDQIKLVDGDINIAPGVDVVLLPGHTPGSQGVLVQGKEKKYLIAGDLIDLYENWSGNETVSRIYSGVHLNLLEYEESFQKAEALEKEGYEIIPSHDRKVLDRQVFV